jgi:hypothetical protein
MEYEAADPPLSVINIGPGSGAGWGTASKGGTNASAAVAGFSAIWLTGCQLVWRSLRDVREDFVAGTSTPPTPVPGVVRAEGAAVEVRPVPASGTGGGTKSENDGPVGPEALLSGKTFVTGTEPAVCVPCTVADAAFCVSCTAAAAAS